MAQKPRVFVAREMPGPASIERLRLSADVTVWPEQDPPPYERLVEHASRSDALLTTIMERIDMALLDASPDLRIVSQLAVGYDNIDVPACTQHGVLVTNTPGVLTETTADLAFTLILAWARRIPEGERIVREGRWPLWHPGFHLGRDVHGKTLGIIGLGGIGTAVARRARGFGMRVLYNSRARKGDVEAALGAEWHDLPDLLRESDYVSIHCALTPETRELIGAPEFELMKPDAVLINTARGGIVDQPALVEALSEHRIGGAALDVFAIEPIATNDPLLSLDNMLVSPHIGSATVETRAGMVDMAVRAIEAFFRGERPEACVNPEVLENLR